MDALTYFRTACNSRIYKLPRSVVTCPDGRVGVVSTCRWKGEGDLQLTVYPPDKPEPTYRLDDQEGLVEIEADYCWNVPADQCRVHVDHN